MTIHVKTYKEFTDELKALGGYHGTTKCFVPGCEKAAYYEGGDARFYCGLCEDHANIKYKYQMYLQDIKNQIRIRFLWDKTDPTLIPLYDEVSAKLMEIV